MSQKHPRQSGAGLGRIIRRGAEIDGAAVSFGKRSGAGEEDDDVIGLGRVGDVEDNLRRGDNARVCTNQLAGEDEAEHGHDEGVIGGGEGRLESPTRGEP